MKEKLTIKISKSWRFLIFVLFIYTIILILDKDFLFKVLLKAEEIIREIIPVLIIVFLLTFFANIWLDNKRMKKIISKQTGALSYLTAVILGIISSGPIYMWYPLLKELKEDGLRNDLIAIFLYNRAIIIPTIPMILYYFGLHFFIISTVLMMVFSLLNGYLVNKFTQDSFKG
ncbi:MAG: hypothetical protein WC893_02130 [Candidatus Paceibacterota bacterium]|jgi:uncharacterized membrane protein YraQ (UPF0718 family)